MLEPIPVCVNEIRAVQNDFDTYDIDPSPVGSGGWGTIYRGVRKSDGKVFSLKFFGYTNRAPNQSDINDEIVQMYTMIGVEGESEYLSTRLATRHTRSQFLFEMNCACIYFRNLWSFLLTLLLPCMGCSMT